MARWITLPLLLSATLLGMPGAAQSEYERVWEIDGQPVLRAGDHPAPCWQLWEEAILCHHGRWERDNDPRGLAKSSLENSEARRNGETTPRLEYLVDPNSPAAKLFEALSHSIPRTKGVMVIEPRLSDLHAALLYIRYEEAPRVLKSVVGPQPTGTSTTLFIVSEATRHSHGIQNHLWTVHWSVDDPPDAAGLLNALHAVDSLVIETSWRCQGGTEIGATLFDCVESRPRLNISN